MPPETGDTAPVMDYQLKDCLSRFIDGPTCVLGIGNRLWRDDGVGSFVAEALEPCQGLDVIDAGFVPENHLETVAQKHPGCILMIDATDFGGKPGQARLMFPDKIVNSSLSTHAGSLRMLAEYLYARTGAKIAVLAVQPDDTDAGEGLSPPVSKALNELVALLQTLFRPAELV